MKNIYEAASLVLIWLGSLPIRNSSGLGVIHSFLNAKRAQEAQHDQRSWLVLTDAERKRYGLPGLWKSVTPEYLAFANLLERAWFTRVWIIQDLAVSHDAIVIEGFLHQCSWMDFITAVDYAETAKIPPFWETYGPTMSIRNIERAR